MHVREGSCFKNTNELNDELWKSLFGIIVVDVDVHDDDDEVYLLVMDIHTHIHFKWNVRVNELLKAPRDKNCYDAITTW